MLPATSNQYGTVLFDRIFNALAVLKDLVQIQFVFCTVSALQETAVRAAETGQAALCQF